MRGPTDDERSVPGADGPVHGGDDIGLLCDPSTRSQAKHEAAQFKSQEMLRVVEQLAGIGAWEWHADSTELIFSEGIYQILGQDRREWAPTLANLIACIHPEDRPSVQDAIAASQDRNAPLDIEFRIARPDGTERIAHSRAELTLDHVGNVIAMSGTCHDVTDRKHAEDRLRTSEERFRLLVGNAPDAIVLYDADQRHFIDANARAECLFGCSREEILQHGPEHFYTPDQPDGQPVVDSVDAHDQQALAGMQLLCERRIRRPAGDERVCLVTIVKLPSTTAHLLRGSFVDITERKAAERNLERVNRSLRALSRCNEVVARAASEAELVDQMCQIIVDLGGYRFAWIGIAEQGAPETVKVVAYAGEDAVRVLDLLQGNRGDGAARCNIGERTIRAGKPLVSQNLTDQYLAPWADIAREHGSASAASFPLANHSNVFGVLQIFAAEPNAFDDDEVTLLQDLANNLAFGLDSLKTRGHNAVLERQWRSSLEAMVAAIANTLEMRDPYTTGHQQRVARLAVAIARELGISEYDAQGIYFAGVIHDIGKIGVPAEILHKPGKLSRLEFALIQEHAEAGYAIIKDVPFPWPIAELVRQHHERLDGSGYPRHIREDEILIGAKIIAVADVVDAITSHRPYRPAIGIETALDVLEKGKGHLFDPACVDACSALFREKRFDLGAATEPATSHVGGSAPEPRQEAPPLGTPLRA